ncbi:MAG: restriction endonuclease subunit S [Rickettsiaceae bacterium]|nr:restriction endonuclease subunit S [Rickettsiaceae bacterium]
MVKAKIQSRYKQTEIGLLPEDWELTKIGQVCSIKTGKRNTQDANNIGLYPFFVRSATIEKINSYSFDGEAVLTPGDGAVGKIFHYINGKFDFHQRVYMISNFTTNIDGFYFYKCFSNSFYDKIMSLTAKSTVDSVRMNMITDMEIPIPPYAEQKAIAKVLSDIDSYIDSLKQLIQKKQDIKTATMQQLLTGKTRLYYNIS